MKRSLLPVITLLVLGFATSASAQTQGYEDTWPEFKPEAFQGCGVLAPGLPGTAPRHRSRSFPTFPLACGRLTGPG